MYTNNQLKQALAKMLPERIILNSQCPKYEQSVLRFKHDDGVWKEVDDTQLLHLCWLVEEKLQQGSLCAMSNELDIMHELEGKPNDASQWKHHKSWQQRTIALAKTLGVKIV